MKEVVFKKRVNSYVVFKYVSANQFCNSGDGGVYSNTELNQGIEIPKIFVKGFKILFKKFLANRSNYVHLKVVTYENSWVWKLANDMSASDRGDRCLFVFNFDTIPSWAEPISISTYSCQLFRLWLPIMQCVANSSPHVAF